MVIAAQSKVAAQSKAMAEQIRQLQAELQTLQSRCRSLSAQPRQAQAPLSPSRRHHQPLVHSPPAPPSLDRQRQAKRQAAGDGIFNFIPDSQPPPALPLQQASQPPLAPSGDDIFIPDSQPSPVPSESRPHPQSPPCVSPVPQPQLRLPSGPPLLPTAPPPPPSQPPAMPSGMLRPRAAPKPRVFNSLARPPPLTSTLLQRSHPVRPPPPPLLHSVLQRSHHPPPPPPSSLPVFDPQQPSETCAACRVLIGKGSIGCWRHQQEIREARSRRVSESLS